MTGRVIQVMASFFQIGNGTVRSSLAMVSSHISARISSHEKGIYQDWLRALLLSISFQSSSARTAKVQSRISRFTFLTVGFEAHWFWSADDVGLVGHLEAEKQPTLTNHCPSIRCAGLRFSARWAQRLRPDRWTALWIRPGWSGRSGHALACTRCDQTSDGSSDLKMRSGLACPASRHAVVEMSTI